MTYRSNLPYITICSPDGKIETVVEWPMVPRKGEYIQLRKENGDLLFQGTVAGVGYAARAGKSAYVSVTVRLKK